MLLLTCYTFLCTPKTLTPSSSKFADRSTHLFQTQKLQRSKVCNIKIKNLAIFSIIEHNKIEIESIKTLIEFIIGKSQQKPFDQMEMNQYGQGHTTSEEVSSLHSDFGPSMINDQAQTKPKQPLISFKYHPGFFCFFQDYTNRQGWTFYECYEKVFQSHHEMMKIRHPLDKIIKDKSLDKEKKLSELAKRSQRDKKFAYYLKRENGEMECNVVIHEDAKIERINKLKEHLAKLEKIKAKVVEQKKKEFQQKEIMRSKEQQLQIQSILNEKERRANLIRKVQLEAEVRRAQFLEEKRLKKLLHQDNPGFFSSVSLDNCKIM